MGLSTTIPGYTLKSMGAEIVVHDNDIYFTTEPGADPAVDGTLAAVGSSISLFGPVQVKQFRAKRVSADAVLGVTHGSDSSP